MPDMMGYSHIYANSNAKFDGYFSLEYPFSLKACYEWFKVVILLKLLHHKKV